LFGGTVPLTNDVLTARYGTHDGFVTKFSESAKAAVAANAILADDMEHLIEAAKAAKVLR
jgi:hypothetical protein